MANIQLLRNYGGRRTNEARIPPGVYYENDPLLCGLADYLVENGHAVFTNEPLPEPEFEGTVTTDPAVKQVEFRGRVLTTLTPDAPAETVAEHYPQVVSEPEVETSEPQSLNDAWTKSDLLAFADEFSIDLGKATRKDDIAVVIETWLITTDFNEMDLVTWYEARHPAED